MFSNQVAGHAFRGARRRLRIEILCVRNEREALEAEGPPKRAFRATQLHATVTRIEYAMEVRPGGRSRTGISVSDSHVLYQLSHPGDEAPPR
jgi:hypothetical protein